MRTLAGRHVLDPAGHPPLRDLTIDSEVHDKGMVD